MQLQQPYKLSPRLRVHPVQQTAREPADAHRNKSPILAGGTKVIDHTIFRNHDEIN